MNDDKIVYWLGNGRGNKYHLYKDCYYMGNCRPDARSGSVAEAKAAGHPEVCKVCEERENRQNAEESVPGRRVYWRYGSDEAVWHLYETCPDLDGAAKEGMLCSGTVEAAINTGRNMVCPLCKKRSGELYYVLDDTEAGKSEPVRTPAIIAEPEKKAIKEPENQTTASRTVSADKPKEAPQEIQKESPEVSQVSRPGKPLVIWKTNWAAVVVAIICTALCVFAFYAYSYSNAEENAYNRGYKDGKATANDAWEDGYEAGYDNGRIARKNSYVVYVTISGKKYHKKDCSYLKSSIMPVDVTDALNAGYTACSRCNP